MEKQDNIKAVLFDFDGTLAFLPIDYDRMRNRLKKFFSQFEINCDFQPIMDSVDHSLSRLKANTTEDSLQELKKKAYSIVEGEELEAVEKAKAAESTAEILEWLRGRKKKIAIITKNGSRCIREVFNKLKLQSPDLIVSRDDVDKVKPDREHVDFALVRLNLKPEECIIVGDSTHDLELGKNAGILTVLVDYENKTKDNLKEKAEVIINSLLELKEFFG